VVALITIRLIRGRAWQWPTDYNLVFLTGAFAIGPGIVVNLILKEHWGRSRPEAMEAFGGTAHYTSPWWPWGECATNCSFVSGEASTSMVLIAFAFICHHAFRLPIIAAATVWTIVISANRMAMGAHFFTDVVISALLTLLIVLVLKAMLIDSNQRPAV
ncbi:MAG: phosphatase PAP2 family protein, partial [Hyphomicrobium sp.]